MTTVFLSTLRAGTEAIVAEVLVPEQVRDQELVMRLVEIGFMPGERVRVIARGQPGDDPIAVRIGHTTFALRRFEAAFIKVVVSGGAGVGTTSLNAPEATPAAAKAVNTATGPDAQASTHSEARPEAEVL